jgi:hypothetical protein
LGYGESTPVEGGCACELEGVTGGASACAGELLVGLLDAALVTVLEFAAAAVCSGALALAGTAAGALGLSAEAGWAAAVPCAC